MNNISTHRGWGEIKYLLMGNIPLISNNFNYLVKISIILNVIKIYVFTVRKKSDWEMQKVNSFWNLSKL